MKRQSLHNYTIHINDLTFHCIIGILEKERIAAQRVVIDVIINYKKESEEFINYAAVTAWIEERMKKGKFFLLEEALDTISLEIQEQFPAIKNINLKICKPDILDNCKVCVEIFKNY